MTAQCTERWKNSAVAAPADAAYVHNSDAAANCSAHRNIDGGGDVYVPMYDVKASASKIDEELCHWRNSFRRQFFEIGILFAAGSHLLRSLPLSETHRQISVCGFVFG